MFWSVIAIFTACEFGEQLGSKFFEIDRRIVDLDWYLFPVKLWHMLPIVMVAAQEPIELHAIGSVSCRRITFKNVGCIDEFKMICLILEHTFGAQINLFCDFAGNQHRIFKLHGAASIWNLITWASNMEGSQMILMQFWTTWNSPDGRNEMLKRKIIKRMTKSMNHSIYLGTKFFIAIFHPFNSIQSNVIYENSNNSWKSFIYKHSDFFTIQKRNSKSSPLIDIWCVCLSKSICTLTICYLSSPSLLQKFDTIRQSSL